MPTKKEIDNLKSNWMNDPCWDIEDTEGFEQHHEELLAFRLEQEAIWQRQEQERITMRCQQLNCSPEVLSYFEKLENNIRDLEAKIECLTQENNLTLSRWWNYKE